MALKWGRDYEPQLWGGLACEACRAFNVPLLFYNIFNKVGKGINLTLLPLLPIIHLIPLLTYIIP